MALVQEITIHRVANTAAAALQNAIQGQVILPEDERYDEARLAHNLSIDHHPALIVAATCAADVVAAVRFARQQGLGIAAQSTGHGIPVAVDDAMLILTGQLNSLEIDPVARTARMGAGLRWDEVLAEAQQHGLAPLLGSSPLVGVVGYTLGGGLGWLARKHGIAADSVVSIDLVTAAGEELHVSAGEHSDLFWALRGGGGAFGIVTRLEVRLFPVRSVYGGSLIYPGELTRAVMQRYRDWIATLPEEMTSSVKIINFPPMPQVPEVFRGKSFVLVHGCYAGPAEAGAALVQSWRDWHTPVMDDFGEMPFAQVAKISNDPVDASPSKVTGAWMRELSDAAIDTIIAYAKPQATLPSLTMLEVRHVGGAMGRAPADFNAFSHRDAPLLLFALGITPSPESVSAMRAYTDAMLRDLGPALTGGVYMNFVGLQEARDRTRDGFDAGVFERLQALKARYDPENCLRFGFAIAPGQSLGMGNTPGNI